MTAKEQVIKSIEDWYQPVKISELIYERKSNMSKHKDKILRYITDWSCELKRNNKGRRKSADAIKTINTRVNHLKEIGCPDKAVSVLIAYRDLIVRNGCANYNKMSLRKVVHKAREIYKDVIEHPNAKRNMAKKIIDRTSTAKQDYIEHCKGIIESNKRKIEMIDKQISEMKSHLDDLEHNKQWFIDRNNETANAMQHYAAFHKITL